jgi:E3 ubiquitin-protein ligase MYCBP2
MLVAFTFSYYFLILLQGKFSEEWTLVSKSAIAEAVLNLTRLGPDLRQPEEGLRCPTLWLAVAALCVLDR